MELTVSIDGCGPWWVLVTGVKVTHLRTIQWDNFKLKQAYLF